MSRNVTGRKVLWGFVAVFVWLPFEGSLALADEGGTEKIIAIDPYGISITPPAGWIVRNNWLGMSLVMQHPVERAEHKDAQKTFFRPNITMTVLQRPTYMDEKGAEEISILLSKQYEKQGIKQSSVQKKTEFFAYRNHERGIVLYSNAILNDIPVTQLHVVISGSKTTAVLTYSDLTERFDSDKGYLSMAYASMTSINVEGSAPSRYEGFMHYGVVGFGLIFMWLGFVKVHRLGAYSSGEEYLGDVDNDESEEIYSDEEMYSESHSSEIPDQGSLKSDHAEDDVWNGAALDGADLNSDVFDLDLDPVEDEIWAVGK